MEINRIELYDFAKMLLGGEEPESVSFLTSDKKTVSSIVEFSSADMIPSVRFSPLDLMMSIESPKISTNSEFPGLI
jgi:hypothetical protein